MILSTERMELIALTPHQIQLWVDDLPTLEKELKVTYQGEDLSGHFGNIVRSQALIAAEKKADYVWDTFWFFVEKTERIVMGSACFKGTPDSEGSVEIGYGISPDFERKGLTTEAVQALVSWAFLDYRVQIVRAETLKENLASQAIVKKCGMVYDRETEECYWWQIHRAK